MSDNGYTFHLGAKFVHHMPYLNEVCAKLNTTRPALIAAVMRRVFEDRLLEELGGLSVSRFKRVAHYQPKAIVEMPVPTPPAPRVRPEPMPLHPLQTRKTTSEPLPELRPKYVTARPHHYARHVERTKTELRDELRAAVENTERLNEDQHGAE